MSRIIVTERVDRLEITSFGSFVEGTPDEYALGTRTTPGHYRNPFLVRAMAELNMIDTMGYGIHRMTTRQAKRYLPLPDFDLSDPERVVLRLYGSVVDPAYTQALMAQTDLPLADVLALDRIQKGLTVPADAARRLRRAGLVEGRSPKLHVAAVVARAAGTEVDYINTRAQDDAHYMRLVISYLEEFETGTRSRFAALLWDKFSSSLTDEQRNTKVGNLLTKMRKDGIIEASGSGRYTSWRLRSDPASDDA